MSAPFHAGPEADPSRSAAAHLEALSVRIGRRLVGTPGNRAATTYVASVMEGLGLEVERPSFRCLGWDAGEAVLEAGGIRLGLKPGPYSLPFDGERRLVAASSMAELEVCDFSDCILLLYGSIASEPIAPRNYVFYNPDEHQALHRLLDLKKPAAIVTATGICPTTAGAGYPFPLFDDGDFDIPSACMKDVEGGRFAGLAGASAKLRIVSGRREERGCNVIGRLPGTDPGRRIVLTAHVDTRPETPGALDDASGVATILAAAELQTAAHPGGVRSGPTLEIAVLNGEDYYAATGEMEYMKANEGIWGEIALAMNVDGAGYREGSTAWSLYGCGRNLKRSVHTALSRFPGIVPGEQWPQGDHSMFAMQGVPAAAFTSDRMAELWAEVAHTERDTTALVDPGRLGELARALSCLSSRRILAAPPPARP